MADAYLPAPRLDILPLHGIPLDLLRSLDVDVSPVDAVLAAHAEAEAAIADVGRYRPGGEKWQAAIAADTEAVVAGKKASRLAAVMKGEPDRYGHAHAMARRYAAVKHALDLPALRAVTKKPAQKRRRTALTVYKAKAGVAWRKRSTRPVAVAAYEEAASSLTDWRVMGRLLRWAEGGPFHDHRAAHWSDGRLNYPDEGEANGHYLAAGHALGYHASGVMTFPQPFVLPDGADAERLMVEPEVFNRLMSHERSKDAQHRLSGLNH